MNTTWTVVGTAGKDGIHARDVHRGEFIDGLRRRDRAALLRFFDRYFDPVLADVSRFAPGEARIEEIVENVFQRIRRSLPALRPGTDLDAWVAEISAACIRDGLAASDEQHTPILDGPPTS